MLPNNKYKYLALLWSYNFLILNSTDFCDQHFPSIQQDFHHESIGREVLQLNTIHA